MNTTLKQKWLVSFTYTNSKIIEKVDMEYEGEKLFHNKEIELLEKETYFGKIILKQNKDNKNGKTKKLDVELVVLFPLDMEVSIYELERYVSYFTNACTHGFGPSFWHSKHVIENLEYKLLNYPELSKAGYSPPTVIKQRYTSDYTFSKENIDQFIQNMNLVESHFNRINYILNYYQLALDSESSYSALVLLWMAFESIIQFASNKKKKISKLINQYIHSLEKSSIEGISNSLMNPPCTEIVQSGSKKTYKGPTECLNFLLKYHSMDNIADALVQMQLKNKDGSAKHSMNLETHLKKSKPNKRKVISIVFQCFYAIRSKLVHGNKKFITTHSERHMHPLRLFMQLVVGIIIDDMFYKLMRGKKLVKCI